MRLTPNLNGTSTSMLIQQREQVLEAINTLNTALRAAWPHGRDYQLAAPFAWSEDNSEWTRFQDNLVEFRAKITAEYETLVRLEEECSKQ